MRTTEIREFEVSESGHIYWNLRNRLGQFVNRHGFNKSRRAEQLEAWRAYLDARREQADEATRGHLLAATSRTRYSAVERFFRPGASLRHASQELVEWFEQAGPTLSFREFAAAC